MTDEQIRELFGVVPYFADTRIEAFQPAHFIRSMGHCDSASVNIGLVYGTSHPAYQGIPWREFLGRGEKMKKNLDRFTVNPEYYLSHERSGTPPFFCFQDGKGYVAEDGNHRACIAKFFLYAQPSPLLHGVHLVDVQPLQALRPLPQPSELRVSDAPHKATSFWCPISMFQQLKPATR